MLDLPRRWEGWLNAGWKPAVLDGALCSRSVSHQIIHDAGISERGRVAQIADVILGNLAQDAAHDFAGARFG